MNETFPVDGAVAGRSLIITRIAVAAAQAAALVLLASAAVAPMQWPATEPVILLPLRLVSLFVPVLIMVAAGQMRPRPLAVWASLAAVALSGLGFHEVARTVADLPAMGLSGSPQGARFEFWLAVPAALFVAHVLVVDSAIEGRLFPSYRRHFDTAWKLGLQSGLSVAFVAVFWAILELGAGLFSLLGIEVFRALLRRDWFYVPAISIALAVSIHVTDVQPALLRSARTIVLTLFAWLLPPLVVILGGFLGSLSFISMQPLWRTHFATALLLTAAGLLIFLINCGYQDGAEGRAGRIQRLAGTLGAVWLPALVGLAAWGLALRVAQYGWSVQRIEAAAVIAVFACYALGYATSTIGVGPWMRRVELSNFLTAYAALILFAALFSPLADPSRLMVASQLARLNAGTIAASAFDFRALRRDGARWGDVALQKLAHGPDAGEAASAVAARASPIDKFGPPPFDINSIKVFPAGRRLPAELASQLQVCAFQGCVARYLPLRPEVAESLVVLSQSSGLVFEADAGGHWQKSATVAGSFRCAPSWREVEAGSIGAQPRSWPDLLAGGVRLTIVPAAEPCG